MIAFGSLQPIVIRYYAGYYCLMKDDIPYKNDTELICKYGIDTISKYTSINNNSPFSTNDHEAKTTNRITALQADETPQS